MSSALQLSAPAQITLEAMRDHHPRPYLRERAAALLKVAAGRSPRSVALHGLHRPRHPDTVHAWLTAYQTHGLGALYHMPRRRVFSP